MLASRPCSLGLLETRTPHTGAVCRIRARGNRPSSQRIDPADRALSGLNTLPAAASDDFSTNSIHHISKPTGTRVILQRSDGRLDIEIPPSNFLSSKSQIFKALLAFFTLALSASNLALAFISATQVNDPAMIAVYLVLSIVPTLLGFRWVKPALYGSLTRERLSIGQDKFRLGTEFAVLKDAGLDGENLEDVSGLTSQLKGSRLFINHFHIVDATLPSAIELVKGFDKHKFGEALDVIEQQWLVQEINQHIEDLSGRKVDFDGL